MSESVLSGVIFAAQFSVAAIISAVGILALSATFIAVNRLFHMFWIPTNMVQRLFNLLNEKGAVKRTEPTVDYQYGSAIAGCSVPIGVPAMTQDGKIMVNVGQGGGGGNGEYSYGGGEFPATKEKNTRRDKIGEKMEAAFKDGVDLSGKKTP